jgi:hypothetical protein
MCHRDTYKDSKRLENTKKKNLGNRTTAKLVLESAGNLNQYRPRDLK